MKPILKSLLFLINLVLLSCGTGEVKRNYTEADIKIIPQPSELVLKDGTFTFNEETKFIISNEDQRNAAQILIDKFKIAAGLNLRAAEDKPDNNYVKFITDSTQKDEAYNLKVSAEKIEISANSLGGFIYGVESLRQLLPSEIEKKELVNEVRWEIPAIEIKDTPRFSWRGLHLDVSRHFLAKDYILAVIDRMAMFKLNTLHMHLVDDQGWRIEIKKYPKLTEIGGFRVDHEDKHWNARPTPELGEEATYGGYYTQEEIKEIVAHAASRGIRVVPEIEMPAHVMSAIAAYPHLSCHGKQIMVPSGGVWPITDIYCAGKESTFQFLEDVLLEVMELFPSKYIHIGGDEATRTNWESCPDCQRRIAVEGLENVEELQSYFIKRMERFLSSYDRVLIGWDEILEGGLAPGATVMSWRGIQGGWEASEQGHDVVMTPGSHMYFDHYQGIPDNEPVAFGGYTTLSKVYEFDPVVDSMSVEQKKHVLGGQANMWSEFIPTPSHSEYMMFPRLAALSEAVWSPEEKKNWKDFSARMKSMFRRLDYLNINYARSAFEVTADLEVDLETKAVQVRLENEFPDSEIRYTLKGEALTENSTLYNGPISLSETAKVKAAVFENGERQGQIMEKTFTFHKAVGKEVNYTPIYHKSYQGAKEVGLVNVLRGSLNFHDGQWQAWLVEDVEVVIDMIETTSIKKVTVGSMENQGSGIYFPTRVEIFGSGDGVAYKPLGYVEREFAYNGNPSLKDFDIKFPVEEVSYIKVRVSNLGHPPTGGSAWVFLDEIVVE